MRFTYILLLIATLGVMTPRVADASAPDWMVEVIADRAAAHGVSAGWLLSVAACETGGTWNQFAVGSQGEKGIFQLHPQGELIGFVRRGYHDPFDVWESADYTAQRFSEGGAGAWTCA